MQIPLRPWGNSQGVRFSREFLASAGIKPDDVLTAEIVDGKIVLSRFCTPPPTCSTACPPPNRSTRRNWRS